MKEQQYRGYAGSFYEQSIKEQVINLIRDAWHATFGTWISKRDAEAIYAEMPLGIDGSHYISVDWSVIKAYVKFVFWKASEGTDYKDPTFPDACQAAYDHDIPFGAYHFFRTDYYLQFPFPSNDEIIDKHWPSPANDLQLQNFIAALRYKKVNAVAVDIEAAFQLSNGQKIAARWINAAATIFLGRVSDYMWKTNGGALPDIPLLIYTSNGFISTYAPDMLAWADRYDEWVAQWVNNPGSVPATWDELKSRFYPADTAKPKPWGNGVAKFWQWSGDRYILPGILTSDGSKQRTGDFNFFIGNLASLHAYMRFTPGSTTPEEPPEEPPSGDGDYEALASRVTALEGWRGEMGKVVWPK